MAMTVLSPTSTVAGPAIGLCQKEDLDAYSISWPQHTAANLVENFTFDERRPKECYVYPPPGSATYVELVYEADVTDCASTSSALSVADQYAHAVLCFVMMMAYSSEIEGGVNLSLAQWWGQQFLAALDLSAAADIKTSPNMGDQGGVAPRNVGQV